MRRTAAVCRAMELIGCGILGHRDNDSLREALVVDRFGEARFVDEVRRITFGLLLMLAGESRGIAPAFSAFERLRAGVGNGQVRGDDRAWQAYLSVLDRKPIAAMLGLRDSSRAWSSLADSNFRAAFDELTGAADVSSRDAVALEPLEIGEIYEQTLAFEGCVNIEAADRSARFTMQRRKASRRLTQGSFYTPDSLVGHVLSQTLDPGMADAAPMDLRVCDPACGTGNFLIAAARRIAARVDRRTCDKSMRLVIENCIYGVDLDSVAVAICRAILWLEAGDPTFDPAILRHHIQHGDALLGSIALPGDGVKDAHRAADAWCLSLMRAGSQRPSEDCPGGSNPHHFFHWRLEYPEIFDAARGGFDIVIGNPPFLNQLQSDTAATRGAAAIMRERSGGAVRGYADIASAFLLLAGEITRPGGRFGLVQPQSLLAARDAKPVRDALLGRASLQSLWVANEHIFDAGVFTCAPTFLIDGSRCTDLSRSTGAAFDALPPLAIDNEQLRQQATWSHLIADARGVPAVTIQTSRVIGDIATATADFRDQYYGLAGCIVEDSDLSPSRRRDREAFPPLVTTGLIDLAANHWGQRPTRIHKLRWLAPRIDRRRLERDTELGPWLASRLVPKVLLATQTRVLEVVVDERGEFVPLVPLITIVPRDAAMIWQVAAALASPVCTVIALREFGGTALTVDAIKLAASQVVNLPCPLDSSTWNVAAELFQRAADESLHASMRAELLRDMADAMLDAVSIAPSERSRVLEWWRHRLNRMSTGRREHDNAAVLTPRATTQPIELANVS